MKKYYLALLCIITAACHTNKNPALQIGNEKRLVIVQRNGTSIEGDKEVIEIKIGDITGGQTDVEITGLSSNKSYLHQYMSSNEKAVLDYHGSLYLIEITHFENHVFHDDKAELRIKSITKEEADKIREHKKSREEIRPMPPPEEEDTLLYKAT